MSEFIFMRKASEFWD